MAKTRKNKQKLSISKENVIPKGKQLYSPGVVLDTEGQELDSTHAAAYYKAIAGCGSGGGTSYRENIAYRGEDLDKFGALQSSFITAKQSISLSKLVYAKFGIVKHALDTMAEFTISNVDFLSSKKASREAMLGWAQAVGLKSFLDQVALEYYRSGNVYIYRFESRVKDSAVRDLSQLFGSKLNASIKIPTSYTIIDPELVSFVGAGILNNNLYQIVIPASEAQVMIQKYKNQPESFESMPSEFKIAIERYLGKNNKSRAGDLIIDLNPDNIIVLYRKKQPYEAYAWPFLTGIFNDLDFMQELRNMDKALSRVISRILIHVAVGDAEHIPSQAALDAIRQKLANASTSTYLITDGAVKITEYYPNIGEMLDPKKYDAVKTDIRNALGISSAANGEAGGSFSNNFLGIKVLVERIKDGRDKILEEFLIPEAERVAKAFNLKVKVTPEIKSGDLNNEKDWAEIYTRLYENGVLSPKSVIECIRDERFPTYEEELENQEEFKEKKAAGLFETNINRGGDSPDSGRPAGTTNSPQSSPKNSTPKGEKATLIRSFTEQEYLECVASASQILKGKFNIKKLNKDQTELIETACKEFLISQPFNQEKLTQFLDGLK